MRIEAARVLLNVLHAVGFHVPVDGMPQPAQVIAEALPLTHFVRLIRGIVLRGAEAGELVGEIGALALFTALD